VLAGVDAGEQITPLIERLERYSKQRPARWHACWRRSSERARRHSPRSRLAN